VVAVSIQAAYHSPYENMHVATRVVDPWTRRSFEVDDFLLPLIEQLWRLGIRTVSSCEDYNRRTGLSWIVFHGPHDAIRFAALLSPRWDDQLGTTIQRMAPAPWMSAQERGADCWQWGVQPQAPTCHCGRSECRKCAGSQRPVPWSLSVSVWLPREDVGPVTETLAAHETRGIR
jgi:hypothetical protein